MRLLAGLDTEYGLLIEGRSAEDQIEDSSALVRAYPGECFLGWGYRYESPRADLRGFTLKSLAYDPEDAKFDRGRSARQELPANRVLPNGARFYNDHGHPEYATPECWSAHELANHDAAGSLVVLRAAQELSRTTGRDVRIYKNNTDFHGASWGTHENYMVPREVGFEPLYRDLLPLMIVRHVLVGAGKVGHEHGQSAIYQLSQRADFVVEPANAETLYRRPIFNTRDEPHADPSKWIRLHVICGDSNMIASATARKVGLMKLAIRLCIEGSAPHFKVKDPVKSFQHISKDETYRFEIELERGSWTTAREIFSAYFSAAEATLELSEEERWTIESSRALLEDLYAGNWSSFSRQVDWAAKKSMIEQCMQEEGTDWRDPNLKAYDLEYSNIDPEESLHAALVQMDLVEPNPEPAALKSYLDGNTESTRARARGVAVSRFNDKLIQASWRSIVLQTENGEKEIDLDPAADYPPELENTDSVESFIKMLEGVK
ncbi:MAG TPA: proteasome accessory factor PafA2 family protein [Fimbriimonas sp.]|nr:proteasome accessory factor PafA2 family protein [Fimbriimonas sp.]